MSTHGSSPTANAGKHIVVIGGGPGGYAAAFHAAELGFKVTLVNAEKRLGGVCLNRGCIPSKAFLHIAKLINEAEESATQGVKFVPPEINVDQLRSWKDGVLAKLAGGVGELARMRKVTTIAARATFKDSHTLNLAAVDGCPPPPSATLSFDYAIVATGSTPVVPGPFQLGDPRVMDSTGALELADIPKKLLVIGGGYIGLEMGTAYAALGSQVTVVELLDGLLMGADRDLVKPLQKRLEKKFAAILLGTKVESLKPTNKGIVAKFSGAGVGGGAAAEQTFDRVLVSVGRRPNGLNLGLEHTQAKVDAKGFVPVDRQQRTADPAIFAIGDVAGEPMLAHKASREAKIAVEVIAGEKSVFDNVAIPAVVFTDPEIAWVGLTETQAAAQKMEVAVARFPWAASGRAMTLGRTEGLTKVLLDPKTERVLGVGIVGSGAGELIAEGALAVEMAAVADDLTGTIHAHPTLSETVMEAAETYFGHSTHLYRPKK